MIKHTINLYVKDLITKTDFNCEVPQKYVAETNLRNIRKYIL